MAAVEAGSQATVKKVKLVATRPLKRDPQTPKPKPPTPTQSLLRGFLFYYNFCGLPQTFSRNTPVIIFVFVGCRRYSPGTHQF